VIRQFQNSFGSNLMAYVISGVGLLLVVGCVVGYLGSEDKPECNPAYGGIGLINNSGSVIVGMVQNKRTKTNGCQTIDIIIQGNSLLNLPKNQAEFQAAANNPPLEVQLRLEKMPAHYQGLEVGTKLAVLYDPDVNKPLAFVLPTGGNSATGLELGSDMMSDYGSTRLIYLIIGVIMLLFTVGIWLVVRAMPEAEPTEPKPRRRRLYDYPEDLPPE